MVTDGCTAWFLSDWLNSIEPIQACCVRHDYEYAMQIGRAQADWNMFTCITSAGFPILGTAMTAVVGLLGWYAYNKTRRTR